MERKKTRLNESEMKVMQIIWNAGHPITGQQVLGQITEQYKGSWHPRTIYPLMRKLSEKGMIRDVGSARVGKVYARQLLFFVRSGLNFDLDAIFSSSDHIGSASLLAVGVVYFVTRILGKYSGAFLGCLLARKNKKVRNNLGLALIPQAGVAIGLAAMGARTLGGAMGDALETIILASSVLYELIGPACAKLSLYLSGSYSNRLDDIVTETVKCDEHEPENEVERLIRQIQAIQKELPAHNDPFLEDEQAYDEAAYEHYALTGYPQVSYQNTRRKADIWTL